MSNREREQVDEVNKTGEEPAAESGAGYGSHAPVDERDMDPTATLPEEKSA